ncbi:MAG: ABC transporter permease subunit [Candidatus Poribacteria bacterium]|nr:ABC transporter permease subunit [Candidatus Poribacteria bacterium]
MLWQIVAREIHDHLLSLRFALTIPLFLILMILNAVGHGTEDQEARLQDYHKNRINSISALTHHTDSLYELVLHGPGALHKKPTSLTFCASQSEEFLPELVLAERGHGSTSSFIREEGSFTYSYEEIWRLNYPQSQPQLWKILPDFVKIDWAFVIGYILSLVALLFTFDAISGEREQGTLRLIMSNTVPRDVLLIGKVLGAFVSIAAPLLIAVGINLFWLSTSGTIQLTGSEWARLGVILLIGLLYLCLFLTLGLLVSICVHRSSVSLMILLLIWTIWVVLIPSALGLILSGYHGTMTSDELRARRKALHERLDTQYSARGRRPPTRELPLTAATRVWGEYICEKAKLDERLNQEHLTSQISQVQFARNISRISPASIVRYAIESLAGTGFPRHLQFLAHVKSYAAGFRAFLVETDLADPDSPHAIGVIEGTSEKPVNFASIPKFEDKMTFSDDFNKALSDILLLLLFVLVLFSGAYVALLLMDF